MGWKEQEDAACGGFLLTREHYSRVSRNCSLYSGKYPVRAEMGINGINDN